MLEGGCGCGALRYRLTRPPMVVHCCHCADCQRQTGSAFVLNAIIETGAIEVLSGEERVIDMPSPSGNGHAIHRCAACGTAVWSNYGRRKGARFVRVGTLDTPDALSPDVHIFTRTKLPWVRLPEGARAYEVFYDDPAEVWSPEARQRWQAALRDPG